MNEAEEQPVQLVTRFFLLLSENTSFNGLFLKMQQNPAYMNLIVSVILLLHVLLLLLLSLLLSRSVKLWNAVHIMSSIGRITYVTYTT